MALVMISTNGLFGQRMFSCAWLAPTMLSIFLGNQFSLSVGDRVLLRGGVISDESGRAPYMPPTMVEVLPPANPPKPRAIVTARETYGLCERLEVTTLQSTGAAGRPFSYSWNLVQHPPGITTEALETLANANATLNAPSSLFETGLYEISVSLTNWLNLSSTVSFHFEIVGDQLPTVVIPGSLHSTVRRGNFLVISTQVRSPTPCNHTANAQQPSSSRIKVRWSQLLAQTHVSNSSASSSSSSSSSSMTLTRHRVEDFILYPESVALQVPANTLRMGETYVFNLEAHALQSSSEGGNETIVGSTNVTFYVTVDFEPVIAILAGGETRKVSVMPDDQGNSSSVLTFDASLSFDPANATNPLRFLWNVTEEDVNGQTIRTVATLGYQGSERNQSRLALNTSLLHPGCLYLVQVIVEGQAILNILNRTASASQRIETTAVPSPLVSLSLDLTPSLSDMHTEQRRAHSRPNPSDKVTLTSTVASSLHSGALRYTWECISKNLNISDRSRLRISPDSHDLVIKPRVLVGGGTYVFRLTVTDTHGGFGTATYSISINSVPALGQCYASPDSGIALSTVFRLGCTNWEDDNTPLSFSFYARRGAAGDGGQLATGFAPLSSARHMSYYDTILPAAPTSNSSFNGSMDILGEIADAFGATMQDIFTVRVGYPSEPLKITSALREIEETLRNFDVQVAGVLILATSAELSASASNEGNSGNSSSGGGSHHGDNNSSAIVSDLIESVATLSAKASETARDTIETPILLLKEITADAASSNGLSFQSQTKALQLMGNLTESPLNPFSSTVITASVQTLSNVLVAATASVGGNSSKEHALAGGSVEKLLSDISSRASGQLVTGEDQLEVSEGQITLITKVQDPGRLQGETITGSNDGAGVQFPSGALATPFEQMQRVEITIASTASIALFPHVSAITHTGSVSVELRQNGQPVGVMDEVANPIRIFIPMGNDFRVDPNAYLRCSFWNETTHAHSTSGVRLLPEESSSSSSSPRMITCSTTHLTAFSAESRMEVNVNEIESEDVNDSHLLSPANNPTTALCIALVAIYILSGIVACLAGRRRNPARQMKAEGRFWENVHRIVKDQSSNKRSHELLCRNLVWQYRRGHAWLAVVLHPAGDYLGGFKRLTILYAFIFNSLGVSTLLVGRRQQIPFLGSIFSKAFVTVMLSLPFPFVVARLFRRRLPSQFAIDVVTMVGRQITALSWFLLCLVESEANHYPGVMGGDTTSHFFRRRRPYVAKEQQEKKYLCGLPLSSQDLRNNAITLLDAVTVFVCVLVMLGTTLVCSAISAAEGINGFGPIKLALVGFAEDFVVRANAIFLVQVMFFSPFCFCWSYLCCCCCWFEDDANSSSRSEGDTEHSSRRSVSRRGSPSPQSRVDSLSMSRNTHASRYYMSRQTMTSSLKGSRSARSKTLSQHAARKRLRPSRASIAVKRMDGTQDMDVSKKTHAISESGLSVQNRDLASPLGDFSSMTPHYSIEGKHRQRVNYFQHKAVLEASRKHLINSQELSLNSIAIRDPVPTFRSSIRSSIGHNRSSLVCSFTPSRTSVIGQKGYRQADMFDPSRT